MKKRKEDRRQQARRKEDWGGMTSIQIQRLLPSPRWKIFRLLARIEDFSRYMPNVRESKIISKSKSENVTEWRVEIDGLPIRWKQKDHFDYENFTITFQAVEGDIEFLEGKWILEKKDDDFTFVTAEVQARLGIPILEKVVSPELETRLSKNFEMMLAAIEENLILRRYRFPDGTAKREGIKGFVVMGHPYNFNHLVRIFKVFKPDVTKLTRDFLLKIFELAPSYLSADIRNYRSATGQTVDGHFVMCPIIPDMALLTPEVVLPKVIAGCRIGEKLGAGILALGGFTSIVGERYIDEIKNKIKIPITTGNSFTSAMALAGIRRACQLMEMPMKKLKAAIIGGTGDIGSACARVLASEVQELTITGRSEKNLKAMEKQLKKINGARIIASRDNAGAVKKADIILAAAGTPQSLIDINLVKPGAVVCDVGYPKNLSYTATHRDDILIFSGGLTSIPTPFDLGFDVGLPSKNILYGCFAESIILSFEKRFENFSEGKGSITPEKIQMIEAMGAKHGFTVAPFFWGDQVVDEKKIERIQSKVKIA